MKYSATHSMGQESGKKSTATLSRTSSPNFVGKLSQRSPTPTLNSNYIKMNYGKSVELYLADGSAEGLVIAELANWNGKAIKINRADVATCEREDFQGAGVYFLFCEGEDGAEGLYVGEAENVRERLRQHIRDAKSGKEPYYWNFAVCFFGRDLNKTLIRYLEHRFNEIVGACGRCKPLTKKTYSNTVMKEWQRAAMEEFIENASILMNALGYRVLVPKPQPTDTTEYFFCKASGADAEGFATNAGFLVLKGSRTSEKTVASFERHGGAYFQLRGELEANGTIKKHVFTRDYEFRSPSAASSVLSGRVSNGLIDWLSSTGRTLRENMEG